MPKASENPSLHVLWDESHLWGLLLHHALKSLSVPFTWIRSSEIADGSLSSSPPKALLVPGGWAKLKSQSLGDQGREEIRTYVSNGGRFLGFCGGAGLALKRQNPLPGLGLCPWKRRSFHGSLPNFSGHVFARVQGDGFFLPNQSASDHLLPVWWPSQFTPAGEADQVRVLASYSRPGPDFWVADLDVSSLNQDQLTRWEGLYGINLRPDMLQKEPCIISGSFGRGSYLLSYSHLETPSSPDANRLLSRILSSSCDCPDWEGEVARLDLMRGETRWPDPDLLRASSMADSIFHTGERNFLLFWRTPWLLGWRRGIPGSQLTTLLAFVHLLRQSAPRATTRDLWAAKKGPFLDLLAEFRDGMERYLLEERFLLSTSPSTPESSSSSKLQPLRESLVGKFPGYGGMFGELIQILDELFWDLIRSE